MDAIDRNKQAIQDFIQIVWREGRPDSLGEFWADDCIIHAAPESEDRDVVALRAYREGFAPAFGPSPTCRSTWCDGA